MGHFRTIVFLSLCAFVLSCQSFQPVQKRDIPSSSRSRFGKCWVKDGSIKFTAFRNTKLQFSAMLDWIREKGTTQWEIYDPLGRTLASGRVAEGKISTKSRLSEELNKIEIKEDGFIYYDSYSLPVKWKELNCLLNFHLPKEWLDLEISQGSQTPASQHFQFKDKERTMELSFDNKKICGLVRTPFMLIFSRERFKWCFFEEPLSAFLDFENTFRLEWKTGEEKESE